MAMMPPVPNPTAAPPIPSVAPAAASTAVPASIPQEKVSKSYIYKYLTSIVVDQIHSTNT